MFQTDAEPSDPDAYVMICKLPNCTEPKFTGHKNEHDYNWMADGRSIAFLKTDDSEANIWVRPVDGGEATQLTHFTDKDHPISAFAWSPDGKRLAITRGTSQSDIVRITGFQ